MLFLMRSKLPIVWDLTFNSVYKLIILSTYLYSNQSLPSFFYPLYLLLEIREGVKSRGIKSRETKNSISHLMGVVDGRSYRVTRLVTCKKYVYLPFLAPRAFI